MANLSAASRGLQTIPSVRIYGITDPRRFEERCSTLSLLIGDHPPQKIADFLAKRGIFTRDGKYYALNLTERLQVEHKGWNAAHRSCTLQHGGRGGSPARRSARIRLSLSNL